MSQPAARQQQLQDAFELFNQVSEQLTGSYRELEKQVVSLNRELTTARSERARLLDEIQALQQQASRSQRLSSMGEMTARLAHQVRTPLSTALLYASQLKQAQLPRDQHDCFVDRLLTGLRHLDHMVNDMLVFARGGQSGDEILNLHQLLDQVRQTLLPQLDSKAARWSVQAAHKDTCIRGRQELLVSVLANLAANTLDICDRHCHLEWQIEEQDEHIQLAFQDNGPGIPAELHEHIFEPFFTTRPGGTGLGLTVVHAVIAAHRGEIEIDPEYREGARFVIRLPLPEVQQQLASGMHNKQQQADTASLRCV